jgi:hypothetical protein
MTESREEAEEEEETEMEEEDRGGEAELTDVYESKSEEE